MATLTLAFLHYWTEAQLRTFSSVFLDLKFQICLLFSCYLRM